MKTFLLNSGFEALQDQSNAIIDKLEFTGFEIGSGIGEIVDRDAVTVVGQLLYTGTVESMYVTPIHTDEILISCEINKSVLEIRPGNILLRVNDGKAFLISISEYSMFKFQTTETSVGTKLIFNIIINIPNIISRFDLSNLGRKVATFKEFATDLDVTRWAWEEPVNQLFVNNDSRINKPAFVISAGRNYWSNPFVANYDELYETWSTKYPWLFTLPTGGLPRRQASYITDTYWTGWNEPIIEDRQEYYSAVDAYEDSNSNAVYHVVCSCGAIIIQATASLASFDTEVLWQLDDGFESNCIKIIRDPDDGYIKFLVIRNDAVINALPLGYVVAGNMFKVAVSWDDGIVKGSVDGGETQILESAYYTTYVFEREGTNSNEANLWQGLKHSYARYSDSLSEDVLRKMSVIS